MFVLLVRLKPLLKKIKFGTRVGIFVDKVQQIYKKEKPKVNNMPHQSYYSRPPLAHQKGLLYILAIRTAVNSI